MSVPTRIIEDDIYRTLPEAMSGIKPDHYHLVNVPFEPPLPNGEQGRRAKRVPMNIYLMSVDEPVIYKDAGRTFIIMDVRRLRHFTYQDFEDCHMVKNSWGYRLAPAAWDPADRLDSLRVPEWHFKHLDLGQDWDEV